ncbi:MAG: glycosyl transferase [Marinilabiliales bacterium]|nr:MAG: glycosyl transferase [Marinilabiliales bacterium]
MAKRFFDIIFSLLAILILFVPGIIIAFLIIITSKGSAFYRQERVGRNGKSFGILKFRTMYKNSDRKGLLTVGKKDPRITRIGYFLRRSKMDELPQFLNIFAGDMSFVGPRPEVKKYVELYSEEQRLILSIRPGLTDYASIRYFDENTILAQYDDPEKAYIEKVMPDKLKLNLEYIRKMNVVTDMGILLKTFLKLIGIRIK